MVYHNIASRLQEEYQTIAQKLKHAGRTIGKKLGGVIKNPIYKGLKNLLVYGNILYPNPISGYGQQAVDLFEQGVGYLKSLPSESESKAESFRQKKMTEKQKNILREVKKQYVQKQQLPLNEINQPKTQDVITKLQNEEDNLYQVLS